jgi:hypothetical protein
VRRCDALPDEAAMTSGLGCFQDHFARALVAIDACGCGADVARLAAQPAFAVYRNTVMKGCIDALQANYPAVSRLVGDEWFRAAAAIFVRAHLPRDPVLLDYGADFADFLAHFDPAAELPYLAGVAKLDRYWMEAHTARDEEPVAASAVARLQAEELARAKLRPHASARWAWFDGQPIATIWRHNREAQPAHAAAGIEWQSGGVLIVRARDAVETIELDAASCAFLDACAQDGTLAEAAAASLAFDPEIDLSRVMAGLLSAGAFGALAFVNGIDEEGTR